MDKGFRKSILAIVLLTGAMAAGATLINNTTEVGASDFSTSNEIIVENLNQPTIENNYNYKRDIIGETDALDEALISLETTARNIAVDTYLDFNPDNPGATLIDQDGDGVNDLPSIWTDWAAGSTLSDLLTKLDGIHTALEDPDWETVYATEIQAFIDSFISGDPNQPTIDGLTDITDISKIPQTPLGLAVKDVNARYEAFYNSDVNSTDGTTGITAMSPVWTDWVLFPDIAWDYIVATEDPDGTLGVTADSLKTEWMNNVWLKAQAHFMEHFNLPDPIVTDDVIIDNISNINVDDVLAAFDSGTPYAPVTLPRIGITFSTIPWTDIATVNSIYTFAPFDGTVTAGEGTLEEWLVNLNVANSGTGYPKEIFPTDFVKASVIADVETALHAAVDLAVPDSPAINAAIYNNIWTQIQGDVTIFAEAMDLFANAIIVEVANIDVQITAFNEKIVALNNAVNNFNTVTVPQWNARIVELNAEITALETDVNDFITSVNNGAPADWAIITDLVNALNTAIDAMNVEIDAMNVQIVAAVALVNEYIVTNFGLLNEYVDFYNLTITYVYEDIYYSVWYYSAIEMLNNEGEYLPPSKPNVAENAYQDTINMDGTLEPILVGPGIDGEYGNADDEYTEVPAYPFEEVKIIDADGNDVAIDPTNPRLTETPTDTYSLVYKVAVRQGKSYPTFDPSGITIYDDAGTAYTSSVIDPAGTLLEADVVASNVDNDYDGAADISTYDIYAYEFRIDGLQAGQEYNFHMEKNHTAGATPDKYDGFDRSVQVNTQPVIFYMPNEVTPNPSSEITEVSANATFNVTDNGTYWNLDADDIDTDGHPDHFDFKIYEGTDATTGTDVTAELNDKITTTYTDDDGTGYGTYSVNIASGLKPDTDYFYEIYVQSYRGTEDALIGIDTDGPFDLKYSNTFKTLPWIAPVAPTLVISDVPLGFAPETSDRKHKRKINYELTIPGAEELTGHDITYVNNMSVYVKKATDLDYAATPVLDLTPVNNGSTGTTTNVIDSGQYILGDVSADPRNTELELGTEYITKVIVEYQGLNAGASTIATVESNEVTFVTEGKSPSVPPSFDPAAGLVFDSATTDTMTLSFKFTDPATDSNNTDTAIEKISFDIENTTNPEYTETLFMSEDLTTATDRLTITWGATGVPPTAAQETPNAADVIYEGTVVISGLNPNADYDITMNLHSNSLPSIVHPATAKIVVSSEAASGKTLKLDAKAPNWDTRAPFEFVSKTQNTLTYSYKFYVPENNAIHKNTYFDSLNIYVDTATGPTTEVIYNDAATDDGDGDPTNDPIYWTATPDSGIGDVSGVTPDQNGVFSGEIVIHNLLPNTTYYIQAGIDSHWYDDDYIDATPTDITEVKLAAERSETTVKLPSVSPWFDEETGSSTIGGLGNASSFIVNSEATGNTIDATFDYKFYLPSTAVNIGTTAFDNDVFETYLGSVVLEYKSTFAGEEAYAEFPFRDMEVTPTANNGTVQTLTTPHEDTVTADDGKTYDLTYANAVEYSGSIVVHNLNPQEEYTFRLTVNTGSEDSTQGLIDPIVSNELTFNSSMLPPAKPYFGTEESTSDGLYAVGKTGTTLSFDFDFTIPTTVHGYEAGILNSMNVYLATNTTDLSSSLLVEGTDYDIEWTQVPGGTTTPTMGEGQYVGTVTFNNLTPHEMYYAQLEIDTNYYAGADNAATETVLSPIAASTTLADAAKVPEIAGAEVFFDKDTDKFMISVDVNTFNGVESDPTGSIADALITNIHVGTTGDADSYLDTPYAVPPSLNGAGEETMNYTFEINPLPFETTISDMVVTVDYIDDGTSDTPISGSVTYNVPSFTTPDIEVITPTFNEESTYVSETTSTSATLSYDISAGDASWQAQTEITRITVQGLSPILFDGNGNPTVSKENSVRGVTTYYDSNLDENFVPGLSGEINIEGLKANALYTGLTVSVEYNSYKDEESKEIIGEGSISTEIDSFQTQPLGTLTPGVTVPPVVEPIESEDHINWLLILLVVMLVGTPIVVVTYTKIKKD